MTKWYYYDTNGQKQGLITSGQLKELAKAGIITSETIIETEDGKTAPAARVKGLTFASSESGNQSKNTKTANAQETILKETLIEILGIDPKECDIQANLLGTINLRLESLLELQNRILVALDIDEEENKFELLTECLVAIIDSADSENARLDRQLDKEKETRLKKQGWIDWMLNGTDEIENEHAARAEHVKQNIIWEITAKHEQASTAICNNENANKESSAFSNVAQAGKTGLQVYNTYRFIKSASNITDSVLALALGEGGEG